MRLTASGKRPGRNRIKGIGRVGALVQMQRIYAGSVIAGMASQQASRKISAEMQAQGNAVRFRRTSVNCEVAVALAFSACPFPAFLGFASHDLRPEPSDYLWR
jgi:hypothetical protein